jgi:LysM domain
MTSTTFDIRTTCGQAQAAPPRPAADAQPPAPTLRLTRRGRAVVVLLVLLAALGAFAIRGAPAASTDVVHHPRTSMVVVSPGETVWDIARRVAPGADPRTVVAEIEDLNSLADAGSIRVGQPLYVPRG